MQRRWTLPAVAALLALAGTSFAVGGFRLLALEARRLEDEAARRAARALAVVERHAREVALETTSPPAERWTVDAPPPTRAASRPVGWGALFTAQGEHIEETGGNLEEAFSLYTRATEDSADPEWQWIATLRAGALAARLERSADARRLLKRAALAPESLLDPRGPSVRQVALYHLAALDRVHVPAFLDAASQGGRISGAGAPGPDDLILALAGRCEDPPAPLGDAARKVRLGHEVARLLSEDGVSVTGDGQVARRVENTLEVRTAASLLENVAVTEAAGIRVVPVGTSREPDDVHVALGPPLVGLEILGRAVDAETGGGALVGLIAGLAVYVLGALLALVAIHRSQRAARMQTDFVAAVSHELKTPIASVRAMAEFLADGPMDDEAKVHEYARRIETEMGRLGSTVRNVLDAARIERQGRLQVSLQPADPAAVVEAVASAFAPTLAARGFTFDVRVAPARQAVPLDAAALQSVLMNLIDNAAKFSTAVREIEIEARPVGDAYRIAVRDRGRGIDAENSAHLFRRFERAEAVRKDAVPGVGLGLYVVREIVLAHAGTVTARPRDGGGTEFTVELPPSAEGGSGA